MPRINSLDFDCQWSYGFNLNAQRKGSVGYLLFWSGCGGLNLTKDIVVWNPYGEAPGQTVVKGQKINCLGLIESFRYAGGEEDPIRISAYVSKDLAANIRAKLSNPLPSTKVKVQWYILAYDNDLKNWYEAALIKDKAKADANIDISQGQVQMFIANEGTMVAETLDIQVYRFEFQIIPAMGGSTNLEFATGASQRLVKRWAASLRASPGVGSVDPSKKCLR
jgi:hypothetical protein